MIDNMLPVIKASKKFACGCGKLWPIRNTNCALRRASFLQVKCEVGLRWYQGLRTYDLAALPTVPVCSLIDFNGHTSRNGARHWG